MNSKEGSLNVSNQDELTPDELEAVAKAIAQFPVSQTIYGTKGRTEFILALSQHHEARVAFESGWISQRMTWLVISQSFLFSAFAVSTSTQNVLHVVLRWLIVVIALIQVINAHASIRAAKKINRRLAPLRGTLDAAIKGLGCEIPALLQWTILGETRFGAIKDTFPEGGRASRFIPITLIAAWAILLAALVATAISRTP